MYKDLPDLRRMIQKAKDEKYPVSEEHMRDLEQFLDAQQRLHDLLNDWEYI